MYCQKCGMKIEDGSKVCPYCGTSQKQEMVEHTRAPNKVLVEETMLKQTKNKHFNAAIKAHTDLLVLGLIQAISLWVNLVFGIIMFNISVKSDSYFPLTVAYTATSYGLFIPSLIFFILSLTRWKGIKECTKVNYLLITVGLSCLYGFMSLIHSWMIGVLYGGVNEPLNIALYVCGILADAAFVCICLWSARYVKKTLHR